MPSRAELERRVDELAEAHEGRAFADAVRGYAETLGEPDREELKLILLARARVVEDAVAERFEVRGWMARTLQRLEELERRRSPPRDTPGR